MPASSIPANACETDAARTASTATWTLPSVRFLNPIGIDRPDPSWRCIWLSVVRAPIAPQATVSAMYCGVIGSRNSQPTGEPEVEHVEQQLARDSQPGVHIARAVEVGIVDQALPADRRPRLLEVDAHRDHEVVGELGGRAREALCVLQRGLGVVHAARSSHDEEPVVGAVEYRRDLLATADDRGGALVTQRQLPEQRLRRHQLHDPLDPAVANLVRVVAAFHPDDHRRFSWPWVVSVTLRFLSFKHWPTGAGRASGMSPLLGRPSRPGRTPS